MRYTSVDPRVEAFRSDRDRFELLPCIKWRLPAPRNMTLPVPVILNRLATAFLVLTPLGRRIDDFFRLTNAGIDRLGIVGSFSRHFELLPGQLIQLRSKFDRC